MRTRIIVFSLLLAGGLAVPASTGQAQPTPPPTCNGVPATLFLTTPGTIVGTPGSDVIVGSSGADFIDAITNEGGQDLICGMGGDDTIQARGLGTKAYGQGQNDQIWVDGGAKGYGGNGNDTMTAQVSSEVFGEGNNDTLTAAWSSKAYGGPGNDILRTQFIAINTPSTLSGDSGSDDLTVVAAGDLADGGSDGDVLTIEGAGEVRGKGGQDTIVIDPAPATGSRIVACGSEWDGVVLNGATGVAIAADCEYVER